MVKIELLKEIPEDLYCRSGFGHDLQKLIEEFAESDSKYCEFIFADGDYKDYRTANGSLRRAVQRTNYKIKVRTFNKRIFMIKDY